VFQNTRNVLTWRGRLFAGLLAVLPFLPTTGFAQSQVVAPRCAQLLSIEQVRTAIGAGLDATAQAPRDPKVLECAWSRAGGVTVSLQFFDRKAIDANPVTHTPDGYYEMIVSASEDAVGRKREPVAGLASRASFVQGQTQLLLVVQRADGVARVLLANVTRPQAAALARAIAGV